jgi:hypothetical protein
MPPFLFRCPNTGLRVQGFVAEETPNDDFDSDLPVRCLSCHQTHLVDLKTGERFAVNVCDHITIPKTG